MHKQRIAIGLILHTYWNATRQRQLFLRYLQRQQMRVSDLITHRFKPHEAASVYSQLECERERSLGVIFDW